MVDQIMKEAEQKMKKTLEITQGEFSAIHTGRASRSLVEGLKVDYYGSQTPLKQLANISTPEARLIIIQPWDPSSVEPIEKAIFKSDLGLTPNNDGKVIRVNVPQLTQERRENLVKIVKSLAEEGKVAIRAVRRDANEKVKKAKNSSDITEDDEFKFHDKIQELTDKYAKEMDGILEKKQTEIREI
ncbi:MAG: ribosome recycling factor [Candidatus Omnitrophica bacterium]|nr:ribosome recycling factor [Candidatus Omnitrophota bacterium]